MSIKIIHTSMYPYTYNAYSRLHGGLQTRACCSSLYIYVAGIVHIVCVYTYVLCVLKYTCACMCIVHMYVCMYSMCV